MKLQEYFHHQKHTFLTDNEKFSLYQQIVAKRDTRKSFLQRYAFAKRFAYASFVALFFVMVYGVHFFRDDLRYMTNSLIVQRWGDTVQAWYIAQIVHFDWWFFIEHQGKPIQTSVIRDGDVVTLKADTQMTFHIDDQTKAKIIWPAQFVLNQQGELEDQQYSLQLLYGDFVEMESLNEETTQNISLITKDLTIHQEKASQASHFKLTNEWGTQRIANKWAQIFVTRTQGDESWLETAIENKQTLAIAANDITLIDDDTQMTRILTQKDVSQTIAFADVKDDVEHASEVTASALSEVFKESDIKIDDRVIQAVDTIVAPQSDDKRIPTEAQDKQLASNLYAWFLNQDANALLEAYATNDDASTKKYIQAFENRLSSIAKTFNISLSGRWSLESLVADANTLHEKILESYYVPPRYMDNILMIWKIAKYILWQKVDQDITKEWQTMPELPTNLRFQ